MCVFFHRESVTDRETDRQRGERQRERDDGYYYKINKIHVHTIAIIAIYCCHCNGKNCQ